MKNKKVIVVILMLALFKSSMANIFIKIYYYPIALTFGHGGINNLNLQFEKPISDIYSLGLI